VSFPALRNGIATAKSTSPFSGGGNLTAHDELVFFIMYNYLFILLNSLISPTPTKLLKNPVTAIGPFAKLEIQHNKKRKRSMLILPGIR
jgi:hypothetical protein